MSFNCRSCIYSFRIDASSNEFQCRRYPPAVYMRGKGAVSGWPAVFADDFCGEFTEEEEPVLSGEDENELNNILALDAADEWARSELERQAP